MELFYALAWYKDSFAWLHLVSWSYRGSRANWQQPFAIIRHLRGRVCNSNHHLRLWARHSAQGVQLVNFQPCPRVSSNRSRDKIKQESRRVARPEISPWKLADFSVNGASHPRRFEKFDLNLRPPRNPNLASLEINDAFLWIQAAISLITRAKKSYITFAGRGGGFSRAIGRWHDDKREGYSSR